MRQEIKERLEKTIEAYGISKAQASREMGYSSSVVSAYTSGSYSGDIAQLEDNIVNWCARQERLHKRKRIPVVETSALKSICKAVQMAHSYHDIALITADAGGSKTTSAKFYAEKNCNTTVFIQVVAGMNRKMLVTEIAEKLDVNTQRVPFNTLVQLTARALAERDSLVIIDEADYLKSDALEFVRRLVYDLGESGLVLMGLPRLRGMIQNLRSDHRQLESRIGISLQLEGLNKSDARLIAQSVWKDCQQDVVNAMFAVSRNDVRQFTKIMERMQNVMEENSLTTPTVEAADMAATLVLRRGERNGRTA